MSPPRMLALCVDEDTLLDAFPGFEVTEYGETGWRDGRAYFYSVTGHPTQMVQRFAEWLHKFSPEPNDPGIPLLTREEIEEALQTMQE